MSSYRRSLKVQVLKVHGLEGTTREANTKFFVAITVDNAKHARTNLSKTSIWNHCVVFSATSASTIKFELYRKAHDISMGQYESSIDLLLLTGSKPIRIPLISKEVFAITLEFAIEICHTGGISQDPSSLMAMPSHGANPDTCAATLSNLLEIRQFLTSKRPVDEIKSISKDCEPAPLIDFLQREVALKRDGDEYRKRCLNSLLCLTEVYGIFPESFKCPRALHDGKFPQCGGGSADIYKGTMDGKDVCLKVLRIFNDTGKDARRVISKFYREAIVWKNLDHPNVLPFLGVNERLFPSKLCLVLPWMSNGNLTSFLSEFPQTNRHNAIVDVAQGIAYLHTSDPPIVHGDIRGANILVADDFRCRLADFGLALVVAAESSACWSSGTISQGSTRWLAPEYLDPRLFEARFIRARDVYAFGCTIIEVYTGKRPFSTIPTDGGIIHEVLTRRQIPAKPSRRVLPSGLWSLVCACMSWEAAQRPSADIVLLLLEKFDDEYTELAGDVSSEDDW